MIFFISTNNGSDMRINKEVSTLLSKYEVKFYGIGSKKQSLLPEHTKLELRFVSGDRRNIATILKFVMLIYRDYFNCKRRPRIHLINETLVPLLYPLLLHSQSVLDLFDSYFLKKSKPGDKWFWIKKIVYSPFNKIIVTDEARAKLMPSFLEPKCVIIGNYPRRVLGALGDKLTYADGLVVMFFGWLGMSRGGEHIQNFLNDSRVRVIACGWFSDENTERLVISHDRIDYRGVMSQEEALKIARKEADYILCTYKPVNMNNIFASPNKIYDALHIETPLIINAEILISNFVRDNQVGWVMPQYDCKLDSRAIDFLISNKGGYKFSENLKSKYSWENCEKTLLKIHEL